MADFISNINFIKGAEGGLSRAVTDSAHLNPSPCTYRGQAGWHTNKGVTWLSFVSLAPKLGYDPSCENFIVMPDAIWNAIYRHGYWDPMQGDAYTSQAIANSVVEIAWGSGVGGALKVMNSFLKQYYNVNTATAGQIAAAINQLTSKTDKEVFDKLMQHRANFYRSLNQPQNLPGWLSRLEKLKQQSLSLLYDHKVAIGAGLFFFSLLAIGYMNRDKIARLIESKSRPAQPVLAGKNKKR